MFGWRGLLEFLGLWPSIPGGPGRVVACGYPLGTATCAAVLGNTVTCYALPIGTATLYAED